VVALCCFWLKELVEVAGNPRIVRPTVTFLPSSPTTFSSKVISTFLGPFANLANLVLCRYAPLITLRTGFCFAWSEANQAPGSQKPNVVVGHIPRNFKQFRNFLDVSSGVIENFDCGSTNFELTRYFRRNAHIFPQGKGLNLQVSGDYLL